MNATPQYVTEYASATGRYEMVCRHCGRAIAQTNNPRTAEYSHIDLQDEGHPGFNCGDENSPLAEPLIASEVRRAFLREWDFLANRTNALGIKGEPSVGQISRFIVASRPCAVYINPFLVAFGGVL